MILLLIFMVITISAFFVLVYPKVFASKNHKVTGWAWTENVGWVSLNCYNSGLLNQCTNTDYGVDYDNASGELSGYAWSENGGWICFGNSCSAAGLPLAPDNAIPSAKINKNGLLSGWASWLVLGADGWIKLQGAPENLPGKKYACRNCAALKGGTAETCGICFVNPFNEGSSEICQNCTNCTNNICATCNSCFTYGAGIDFSNNTMVGWAWNNSGHDIGFGWLKFHSTQTQAVANAPFIETVGGDIYAQKGIGSLYQATSPEGKYSATYLLQSNGDIVHFTSQCATENNCEGAGWLDSNAAVIDVPGQANNYYNKLGGLDIKGILSGQYGAIEFINNDLNIDNVLGGKVYYFSGDLNLAGRIFPNGVGANSGAGTIVVKGNLYINGDLSYQAGAVNKIKNLASLGVIVLKKDDSSGGNVYIDPLVRNIVGSYIAENTIYTGKNVRAKDVPLQVDGLLIARDLKFQRDSFDLSTKAASERVIYDGRVITNPPSGFVDLGKALPRY